MDCLGCGNCKEEQVTYYCPARNEFIINEKIQPKEKIRTTSWKKGIPQYEKNRRLKREIETIG